MKFIFFCFACLVLCVSAMAQVTAYESPITKAAKKLVAVTRDGYYANLMFSDLAATINPCAITLCDQKSPLPVTLITFTGERIDEANVALFWETSEEVNNSYFEVERTLNPSWGYKTINRVKGAGSAVSTVRYETKDTNDYTGYTYYRLKQVDIDGTFEYSSVIKVKGGLAPLSVKAFPNPVQSKNIAFKITGLKVSEQLVMIIYDVRGQIIYQNNDLVLTSNEQIFQANLTHVLPGKYSIKIKSKDRQATGSFVVVP